MQVNSASEAGAGEESSPAALECKLVTASIKKKADRHKSRARTATLFLTGSTASIPVFIGLSGNSFVLGKVMPSVLAALSAVAAALVELERPHERWNLYRRYQRILEGEATLFRFRSEPYSADYEQRELLLAQKVALLQLDLHDEWAGLLPKTAEVAALKPGTGKARS